eukprot:TRINITY_DN29586_c0_g1_i1.p1 TRINITY_DN29586_c0_g1~~TRINITY_DN29586_c0_g1_i1.p1  ORF type:complete len:310 (-),score=31.78 TRINITY_DN29586_c0_g1_i1:26-955(-)
MQLDCNLVLYTAGGIAVWSSKRDCSKQDGPNCMRPYPGYSSPDCRAIMQDDGLLTIYGGGNLPLWQVRPYRQGQMSLRQDGLVITGDGDIIIRPPGESAYAVTPDTFQACICLPIGNGFMRQHDYLRVTCLGSGALCSVCPHVCQSKWDQGTLGIVTEILNTATVAAMEDLDPDPEFVSEERMAMPEAPEARVQESARESMQANQGDNFPESERRASEEIQEQGGFEPQNAEMGQEATPEQLVEMFPDFGKAFKDGEWTDEAANEATVDKRCGWMNRMIRRGKRADLIWDSLKLLIEQGEVPDVKPDVK